MGTEGIDKLCINNVYLFNNYHGEFDALILCTCLLDRE
jgi:hypothetical protein